MTHLRTYVAMTATAAALALGQNAFAQDDLEDLLAGIEADAPAAQPAATEEKTEEAGDPPAEEAALAEEAAEPAEESAPAAEPAADDADAALDVVSEVSGEEPAEAATEEPAAEAPAAVATTEAAPEEGAPAAVGAAPGKDAELIDELNTYERLRRQAMDAQAMREIEEARASMVAGEFLEAVRHYGNASKFLNDRPGSKVYKEECREGIAEGLYQAALEEDRIGRRDRAIKLMSKAGDMRHPKARRQLEAWSNAGDPDKYKTDVSEISHRRNDAEYKARREREIQHLKRARHHLAQREIDLALEECELVIKNDPYNQEAIRLRDSIQRKRDVILKQEREVTREAMIADVDEAWRPVYAVDARELDEKDNGKTIQSPTGPDRAQTMEQSIISRMKEMRLPAISFKPPATIIDAVEYFRGASKDFDRPDIPIEKRGFNFVLKTPEAVRMKTATAADDSDDFSDTGDDDTGDGPVGVPVIPMITASDITFYDALKLVCESVDYKFSVQGPIVMVMHKDMSTEELVTRSFPVLSTFLEKMSTASEDMTSMQTSGFGGAANRRNNDAEEESQERDWKEFFSLLGVKWPEGSSIFYVKTVGRLFVKNTQDNLAEFENVLLSLNQQVTLVEIETRFVEVCQDDLNSLGFEWILNGDYTLGLNRHIARALGIKDGAWAGSEASWGSPKSRYNTPNTTKGSGSITGPDGDSTTSSSTTASIMPGSGTGSTAWHHWNSSGRNPWNNRSSRNIGVNAIPGVTDFTDTANMAGSFSTGERYLSTLNNHISGQGNAYNDQFMKVNAFLGNADLSMILHMLSQRSDTDLLSAPKVLTRPGEEAVMKVVTEYIYPTDYDVQLQSSSSGGGYGGGSSQSAILAVVEPQSFTMREVGVILQVTPTLTDDGNVVDLELNTQVVDEPTWKNYGMRIPFTGNASAGNFQVTLGNGPFADQGYMPSADIMESIVTRYWNAVANMFENLSGGNQNITYYDAPMEQPFFHVRSVDSKVSVYPGATIVMGGLITEARKAMDDKIPFLGDLPFIGRLFRSHSEQTSKRNLLIFVTTRIVDGRGREMHNDGFNLEEPASIGEVKSAPEVAAE